MVINSDLEKDIKMIIYNDLPHGFLNYDVPQGLKVARKCVDDAANILNELLNYEKQLNKTTNNN